MKINSTLLPKEIYSEVLDKLPICCVDVVLVKEKKVLLVLRNKKPLKGIWFFPGGRVFKGENLEQTAKRKCFEETGLDTEIIKQIGVYETFFDEAEFEKVNSGTHTINICFLAQAMKNDQKVRLDTTSESFKWIESLDQVEYPYLKKVLEDSGVFNVT